MKAHAISTVERIFEGETIVCLGRGSSLTQADVDRCRGRARVMAINTTWTLAPWADVLYGGDQSWWAKHEGVPEFAGLKYTIESQDKSWPGLQVLKNTGVIGLERSPNGLKTGLNSGYQAINLAVHLGAKQIVLLGYDMRGTRFDGGGVKAAHSFALWIEQFATLVDPLKAAGVCVMNCTPNSALTCFPCITIEVALQSAAYGMTPLSLCPPHLSGRELTKWLASNGYDMRVGEIGWP